MKSLFGPGLIAGLSLACALSVSAQTQDSAASHPTTLPTPAHAAPANNKYDYDFIAKGYVWSNKPLKTTASKVCQVMRDHSFSETAYAINGEQDWNACLDTQIRSIGYMRWLQNDYHFKPTSKNRKFARNYLQKNYTVGPFGSYTFAQLQDAVKNTNAR